MPHEKQETFFRRAVMAAMYGGLNRMFASTGNRVGKTEMIAAALMYITSFVVPQQAHPSEYPVLNASITQDQANIGWRICERFAMRPRFEHWVDDIITSPFPTIKLAHGGQLWARSTQYDCKYIEGHKFRVINFDEIALGTEESLAVLKMRVADVGGFVSGTGTPRGKNWYYRTEWRPAEREIELAAAEGRTPTVELMRASSYDNPYISHEYIREMEMTMSKDAVAQKIYGEFVDDAAKLFKDEAIEGIRNPDLNDDMGRVIAYVDGAPQNDIDRVKAERELAGYWINAWDLAYSQDWCVGMGIRVDCKPWRLLYFTRFQRIPWPEVERRMDHLAKVTNCREFVYDATGMDQTGGHLEIPRTRLFPFKFGEKSKQDMLTNMVRCIEHKMIEMPYIQQVDEELHDYERDDKNLVQDCVMTLGMGLWRAANQSAAMEML